jgi:hypothetical protein
LSTSTNIALTVGAAPTYSIGGTITGLSTSGLVLSFGGQTVSPASGATSFTFPTKVASGTNYTVTVTTEPTSQTQICTVTSGGSGTATANVTNVQVTCYNLYTIGGTINGLSASGLVLADFSQTFSPASGATSFTFYTSQTTGSEYSVIVQTQPIGENCSVTSGGSGTVGTSNVTNVVVSCTASPTYTIGPSASTLSVTAGSTATDTITVTDLNSFTGSVTLAASGLPTGVTAAFGTNPTTGSSVVTFTAASTAAAGTSTVTITGTSGTLIKTTTIALTVAAAGSYTIAPTPSALTVTAGGAAMDNITVTDLNSFTGSVTLAASGLPTGVTAAFSTNPTISSSAVTFTAATTATAGTSTVTITGTSGTLSVTTTISLTVAVPTTYSIGGTITGLSANGLVLSIGSQSVSPALGATSFAFPTKVTSGTGYTVIVQTQPTGENCSISSGGSGTVGSSNVTSVVIACLSSYTIGGTVSGLTGTGLVLQNNLGNNLTVSANGSFTFSTGVAIDGAYSVTVLDQPISPDQNCAVLYASGTATANVTNVQVTCSGDWVWMGGSDTYNSTGSYGTQFTASAANAPPARSGAVSWTDASGNFWLFGGGPESAGPDGQYYNDLWKYNPTSKEWTWMSGSDTISQGPTYGTLGTAAAANVPGARWNATACKDASGNLWLFGGSGDALVNAEFDSSGVLNDLWKYNPTSGYWTWMGGATVPNDPSVYGTLGTPGPSIVPGARWGGAMWADASGNIWLFGGQGNGTTTTFGLLNDLWMYNPTTKYWAWMGGSNSVNQVGTYGVQGTPAAGNLPGGRYSASSWTDASGNFWLFGGTGYNTTTTSGYLNDLWKFTPTSGTSSQWTWMGGTNLLNQFATYGTQGTASSSNIPGARAGAASWTDTSGNLWLFAGFGEATYYGGGLNDLWKFNPTSGAWTWMSGSNGADQASSYGTETVPAPSNIPGQRSSATGWADASGNIWILGGFVDDTSGDLNDLWEYLQ